MVAVFLAEPDSSSSNALFALLGVVITGVVTMLSLIVKDFLDRRTERERFRRQREAQDVDYARDAERQRDEKREKHLEAKRLQRLQALARFLAETIALFNAVSRVHAQWRQHGDGERRQRDLRAIDSSPGQVAFEEVRLIASDKVVELSSQLWQHIRGDPVITNTNPAKDAWRYWRDQFWRKRQALISAFQEEYQSDEIGGQS
jgi:hypothetical protein